MIRHYMRIALFALLCSGGIGIIEGDQRWALVLIDYGDDEGNKPRLTPEEVLDRTKERSDSPFSFLETSSQGLLTISIDQTDVFGWIDPSDPDICVPDGEYVKCGLCDWSDPSCQQNSFSACWPEVRERFKYLVDFIIQAGLQVDLEVYDGFAFIVRRPSQQTADASCARGNAGGYGKVDLVTHLTAPDDNPTYYQDYPDELHARLVRVHDNFIVYPDEDTKHWSRLTHDTLAHEVLHTFGEQGHANALDCGTEVMTPDGFDCSASPYGDYFDILGYRYFATNINAGILFDLGWIDPYVVTVSRQYSLSPLTTVQEEGVIRALRVDFEFPPYLFQGVDGNDNPFYKWMHHLYIEYRDLSSGFDYRVPYWRVVQVLPEEDDIYWEAPLHGALLHAVDCSDPTNCLSYLLDMHPEGPGEYGPLDPDWEISDAMLYEGDLLQIGYPFRAEAVGVNEGVSMMIKVHVGEAPWRVAVRGDPIDGYYGDFDWQSGTTSLEFEDSEDVGENEVYMYRSVEEFRYNIFHDANLFDACPSSIILLPHAGYGGQNSDINNVVYNWIQSNSGEIPLSRSWTEQGAEGRAVCTYGTGGVFELQLVSSDGMTPLAMAESLEEEVSNLDLPAGSSQLVSDALDAVEEAAASSMAEGSGKKFIKPSIDVIEKLGAFIKIVDASKRVSQKKKEAVNAWVKMIIQKLMNEGT